jgi:uncharacterized membrane protein YkoI
MKTLLAAFVLVAPTIASATDLPCSIKAAQLDAKTKAMAKVPEADARKTALAQVEVPGASISSGGLEVEDGCLLYTYDIKVPGRRGFEEIVIDAGNGKVLLIEHESAAQEATEKLFDKAPEKK